MPNGIPSELEALRKFHGHLGPYVVVGYKMGLVARERLGEGKLSAVVDTGPNPPISCIVDGVQFSTSCTLGKGNIKVNDLENPRVSFRSGDRRLVLRLKDELKERIDREMSKGDELVQSLYYYNLPNEELLEISGVLDVV